MAVWCPDSRNTKKGASEFAFSEERRETGMSFVLELVSLR